jgi:predicted DNA-binding ArsR family transcriptional regulator
MSEVKKLMKETKRMVLEIRDKLNLCDQFINASDRYHDLMCLSAHHDERSVTNGEAFSHAMMKMNDFLDLYCITMNIGDDDIEHLDTLVAHFRELDKAVVTMDAKISDADFYIFDLAKKCATLHESVSALHHEVMILGCFKFSYDGKSLAPVATGLELLASRVGHLKNLIENNETFFNLAIGASN